MQERPARAASMAAAIPAGPPPMTTSGRKRDITSPAKSRRPIATRPACPHVPWSGTPGRWVAHRSSWRNRSTRRCRNRSHAVRPFARSSAARACRPRAGPRDALALESSKRRAVKDDLDCRAAADCFINASVCARRHHTHAPEQNPDIPEFAGRTAVQCQAKKCSRSLGLPECSFRLAAVARRNAGG